MKISIYSNHKTVKTIKPKPEHFRKIADTNWRLKRADRKLTFWPRVKTLRTKVYLKLIMNDSALFDFIFRRFRFTWRRSKLTRDLCKICVSPKKYILVQFENSSRAKILFWEYFWHVKSTIHLTKRGIYVTLRPKLYGLGLPPPLYELSEN